MSKTIIFARIHDDGSLTRVASDGDEKTSSAKPMAPLIPEQVQVPLGPDPQSPSIQDSQPAHLKPPHVARLRRALFMTQREFAAHYRIPLATLRDWERERAEPDQTMCAYLTVIARHPEIVRRALQTRAPRAASRARAV